MKTLPRKITKAELEALPEAVREYYSQSGESFVLAAEDAVAAQQAAQREREARELAERELAKTREELAGLADRKNIDPKRYEELVKAAEDSERKKAEEEKNFAKLQELAVAEAVKPYTERIRQMEADVATLTGSKTSLEAQLAEEMAFTDETLVGSRLKGWAGQKVHPKLQAAFEAYVTREYGPFVKRDGKNRVPLFRKGDVEVPWEDFLKEVEGSDWARAFLLSETNGNGGGGSGSAGGGEGAHKGGGGGPERKTVKASQMDQHLEAIAKGEVVVVEG